MRYAISYVSTQKKELDPSEVVQILHETEIRNTNFGVNGLLVYSEGNFFEVIEGEKEKITTLYRSIFKDERHKSIILIFKVNVKKPLFKDEETHFISENTLYRTMEVEHFWECIKDLDAKTQNTVNKMLTIIGFHSNTGMETTPNSGIENKSFEKH